MLYLHTKIASYIIINQYNDVFHNLQIIPKIWLSMLIGHIMQTLPILEVIRLP